MEESSYRQVLTTTIPRACPFEKSILTSCAACSKAEKHNIAEREIVACGSAELFGRCIALRDSLQRNFAFALGKPHIDGPLPHAQEMRVQCGGLKALQRIFDGNDGVQDVSELVFKAQLKYGELGDYPYSQIVQLANRYYKPR